ncbi:MULTISPECIES: hypothetical protein [unclassified Flavobacterium]|uniref:hypothetical protein n=1 Tax=unclassified Flavobacterium TaxID=196869 RepID=UPI001F1316F6|nr:MULTISPECIES: hypothetical protein [unclassified Flavobacterium]UMY65486.1 hypothetical protein MKO97_13390 [Flavobacterium sp. HJ-32-4]
MEELDLLKKAWKNDHGFTAFDEREIYAMLHRRSSSIVKWILIISILEVALWLGLGLTVSQDDYMSKTVPQWINVSYIALNVLNYGVVLLFVYLFYRNYRAISTTASTRNLMSAILKTRRTVQWYVGFQLGMMGVGLIIGMVLAYNYNPQTEKLRELLGDGNHQGWAIVCVFAAIVFMAVFIGFAWLFYRLLYGILLRKLYRNYNELKRIDTL